MQRLKNLIFLHSIVFLYALSSICSKYAAGLEFFSLKWCFVYALQIFILGCYALLWQQVLKRMPLNFAFANKSVTLVWGMLFGVLIFKEELTVFNIIGAAIVLAGVIVMVSEGKTDGSADGALAEGGAPETALDAGEGEND